MSKIKVKKYRNIDGRIVATSNGEQLIKHVSKKKHYFKNMQGWGYDAAILREAAKDGIKEIVIHDNDEDKTYKTLLDTFFEFGVPVNYGYEDQLILPGRYWYEVINEKHDIYQLKLEIE